MSDGESTRTPSPSGKTRAASKKRSKDETVDRLVTSAIATLRSHGIAGVSARTIAAAADVNQALIFYHFEGMDGLLAEACRRNTEARVVHYRDRFAAVTTLRELLNVGREIHITERAEGNVAVLAQLLAAGQSDTALAQVTKDGMNLWVAEIEAVVTRVLRDSPLVDLIEPVGLSRALSAAFVGLELYEGVDPEGGQSALDALERLGTLIEVVEDLGPVARRVVRSRLRRLNT
jgi:AcrR family transcriptional regulator